jgi:hypothetical protein
MSPFKNVYVPGKTFIMKTCLWAFSSLTHLYNNSTSAEYVLSKAASTTLLIGLEDSMSVAKEEKLFVSIFDDAVYATKSEGSKQTQWLIYYHTYV